MKAKEYLARFRKDEESQGFENALKAMCVAMLQEMAAIIKLRHCQKNSAVLSVIYEMNDRWNAMHKHEPRFIRDRWKDAWIADFKAKGLIKSDDPEENRVVDEAHIIEE